MLLSSARAMFCIFSRPHSTHQSLANLKNLRPKKKEHSASNNKTLVPSSLSRVPRPFHRTVTRVERDHVVMILDPSFPVLADERNRNCFIRNTHTQPWMDISRALEMDPRVLLCEVVMLLGFKCFFFCLLQTGREAVCWWL